MASEFDVAREGLKDTLAEHLEARRMTIQNSDMVNALPVEVLTRIFQLATELKSCMLDPRGPGHNKPPKGPIQLTHVCARWRQIITSAPLFWSHIDITPRVHTHEAIRSRAQAFIMRTDHYPLDVHIIAPFSTSKHWISTDMQQFISPLIPRMRSLDLNVPIYINCIGYDPEPQARDFCTSTLSLCFGTGCTAGALTRVALAMDTRYSFLVATEDAHRDDCLPLDLPADHLEDIWRHIIVLKLEGLFPYWTSSAYHGLVELSLGIQNDWRGVSISENHLVNILSSSPQLSVLNLGLPIIPASIRCEAVALPDLRTLILRPNSARTLRTAMRLIAPGPKPLQLTIRTTKVGMSDKIEKAVKYISHANINALHFILGLGHYSKFRTLKGTIDSLAFTIFTSEDINTITGNKPTHFNANRLHVLSERPVRLEIESLLRLIRAYQPQGVLLWGPYQFFHGGVHLHDMTQIEGMLSSPDTAIKILLSGMDTTPEYYFE